MTDIRRTRAQCPGCLSAHHAAGLYCGACEAGYMMVEVCKAAVILAAGAVLVALAWWVM